MTSRTSGMPSWVTCCPCFCISIMTSIFSLSWSRDSLIFCSSVVDIGSTFLGRLMLLGYP